MHFQAPIADAGNNSVIEALVSAPGPVILTNTLPLWLSRDRAEQHGIGLRRFRSAGQKGLQSRLSLRTVKEMQAAVKRGSRKVKYRFRRARAHVRGARNGHVHVISPATATEIRRTLGIGKSEIENVLRAFRAAGVAV